MKTNKIVVKQIVMTVLAIGFLGYVGYNGYLKNKVDEEPLAATTTNIETTVTLEQVDIDRIFPASSRKGNLIPVYADREGSVKRLVVSDGQQIQKGDLLLSLSSNTLSESQLTRREESTEYINGLKELLKKLAISGTSNQYEGNSIEDHQQRQKNVEDALARAEVNHAMLLSELNLVNIYATSNGIIQEIKISNENNTVVKGSVLMQIKPFQTKDVEFKIKNSDYRFILDNISKAAVLILNKEKESLVLTANEISNIKASGLEGENDDYINLSINSKALYSAFKVDQIKWTFKNVAVLSIPSKAIFTEDSSMFVWKVNKEGTREKTQVDVVTSVGEKSYVRKGLKEGDVILSTN